MKRIADYLTVALGGREPIASSLCRRELSMMLEGVA
jgi:hypothetical protein